MAEVNLVTDKHMSRSREGEAEPTPPPTPPPSRVEPPPPLPTKSPSRVTLGLSRRTPQPAQTLLVKLNLFYLDDWINWVFSLSPRPSRVPLSLGPRSAVVVWLFCVFSIDASNCLHLMMHNSIRGIWSSSASFFHPPIRLKLGISLPPRTAVLGQTCSK